MEAQGHTTLGCALLYEDIPAITEAVMCVTGAPKATHCMACKEEGMVNVVSRKCHCGRAVPNFGAAGQKKRTHCAQCKEQGMVNLSKNPAARQPLPQIPVGPPPPMPYQPQDPMMALHHHHPVSLGQQVTYAAVPVGQLHHKHCVA